MIKNKKARCKPGGDYSGLALRQIEIRQSTRQQLLKTLGNFNLQHSQRSWTNIEICIEAGLKSTVSLKKSWNSDILESVVSHSKSILAAKKSDSEKNERFEGNSQLLLLVHQLRSIIAIRDAELNVLTQENRLLKKRLDLHQSVQFSKVSDLHK